MLFDQNRIDLQLMVTQETKKAVEKQQLLREVRENRDGVQGRRRRRPNW